MRNQHIQNRFAGAATKQIFAIVVLFAAVAIFIVSGAAGWLVNMVAGRPMAADSMQTPAASVAEAGVETLLTVDFGAGTDAWLAQVCAASTAEGCEIAKNMYADGIRSNLEKYRADQTCEATARKMVSESNENGKTTQVWAVEYTTLGWGAEKTDITPAIVEQGQDGRWTFVSVLPTFPSEDLWQLLTPAAPVP